MTDSLTARLTAALAEAQAFASSGPVKRCTSRQADHLRMTFSDGVSASM